MKRNGAPFLWNGCAVLAEYAKKNPRKNDSAVELNDTPFSAYHSRLKLVQSSTSDDILGYKTKELSVVKYRCSTNDFVKGYPKTGIATMFKPKDGEEYFKRRLRKEEGIQHD